MKVSVIIAAYNEGPRIGRVLKVLKGHPLVGEVIVVNDGSSDNTANSVKKFKFAKLLNLKKNSGKAFAVKKGAETAKGQYVMMLDADLLNLKAENITALAKPIVEGNADMTLSLRKHASVFGAINKLSKVDWFSGERCFPRKVLQKIRLQKNTRFGLEARINDYAMRNNFRVKIVDFRNVRCVYKVQKMGFYKGTIKELEMTREIVKAIPAERLAKQFIWLTKIARKDSL